MEKQIILELLESLATKYAGHMELYTSISWWIAFVFALMRLIYFGYSKYIELYSKHIDFEIKKKEFKRKMKDEKPHRIIT